MRRGAAGVAALALALAAAGCSDASAPPSSESGAPAAGEPRAEEPAPEPVGPGAAAGPGAVEPESTEPEPEPMPERTTYEIEATFDPASRRLTGTTVALARNDAAVATSEARWTAYLNAFSAEAIRTRDPVLPEHRKRAYAAAAPDALDGRLEAVRASVDGAPAAVERRGQTIAVALPEPWAPGEWRRIELAWEATLPAVHHRFGAADDAYWFGNALPILAAFDGEWRDYAYEPVGDPFYSTVADFRVRLTAPREYDVVATGDETVAPASASAADGWATTTVDAPLARDFAFALGAGYRVAEASTARGARVFVHFRHASEARAAAAAEAAAGIADLLEGWVGAYPYGEMDIFENEMFVTGMEYPGLAFVRADRLNDPDGVETVAHEVAHQWFYNVIGNDQVREPWLDEGFATYATDVYLLGDRLDAVYAERLRTLRKGAAVGDVRTYDSWSAYWNGNYRKGALLLHALRGELGEEGFDRFLKAYYEEFRFGVVTTESFAAAAERVRGEPMDAFFDRWLP
ncbi:M1 family metallopeptidase [Paenibacillus antri]|uniref:M1 family metallopeptidase n=1 Tax=Paenibacillus antri TaxID=2582848 RepID=A0A5R9GKH3_9BACL|nr:M1 family metallopeptidase [Paenibacillus antri]TLS53998.1 M1 family metallopeptidase [Paenibacillus antri]